MRSWPIHTIQFRAGANHKERSWLVQDLVGWVNISSIHLIAQRLVSQSPNPLPCSRSRSGSGNEPLAMVARKTSWDSVPMVLVGPLTIGGLVTAAMESVMRPMPGTSSIHARKVQAGSWFPMLSSRIAQLRRSGRDGCCGELGTGPCQPLKPLRRLRERWAAA